MLSAEAAGGLVAGDQQGALDDIIGGVHPDRAKRVEQRAGGANPPALLGRHDKPDHANMDQAQALGSTAPALVVNNQRAGLSLSCQCDRGGLAQAHLFGKLVEPRPVDDVENPHEGRQCPDLSRYFARDIDKIEGTVEQIVTARAPEQDQGRAVRDGN